MKASAFSFSLLIFATSKPQTYPTKPYWAAKDMENTRLRINSKIEKNLTKKLQNKAKMERKQHLIVLFKACFFEISYPSIPPWASLLNFMAQLAS
jgi:hypothetical protein